MKPVIIKSGWLTIIFAFILILENIIRSIAHMLKLGKRGLTAD